MTFDLHGGDGIQGCDRERPGGGEGGEERKNLLVWFFGIAARRKENKEGVTKKKGRFIG